MKEHIVLVVEESERKINESKINIHNTNVKQQGERMTDTALFSRTHEGVAQHLV